MHCLLRLAHTGPFLSTYINYNNLNSYVFQINVQMNFQYIRTYYLHVNLVKTREAIKYTGILDRVANGCRVYH